ncbi:MAG: vWA domain-containing protein, partial [Anaerovorax sp.]
MKKKTGGARRALAFLLTIALVCTYTVPTTAFAGNSGTQETQIVNQGGTSYFKGGVPSTVNDKDIETAKTIVQTGKNTFDITLKVKTKDAIVVEETKQAKGADVVLVIDRSGSMTTDDRIGQAKAAATTFVDSFLEEKTIEGKPVKNVNRIALVTFDKAATVESGFISSAAVLNGKIDGIETGSGTNMHAGLYQAEKLISNRADKANAPYLVFLGDGAPNAAYVAEGSLIHDGKNRHVIDWDLMNGSAKRIYNENQVIGWGSVINCNEHQKQKDKSWRLEDADRTKYAKIAIGDAVDDMKNDGVVRYTIGLGVKNDSTAKNLLQNIIASTPNHYSGPEGDIAGELETIYETIQKEIAILTEAWTVSDPMGQFIKINEKDKAKFAAENGVEFYENQEGFVWNLRSEAAKKNMKTENGEHIYTLTYSIVLDTEAENFVAGTYNTNKTTT